MEIAMSPQLKWFYSFSLVTIIITIYFIRYMPERADTIYTNGKIYTMNTRNTVAEALAVLDDRIVGVGPQEYIQRKFNAKNTIDLNGRTVLPGLIDAHCHLYGLGLVRLTIDLVETNSENEAIEKVAQRVTTSSIGQWIRGRGWDQNKWQTKLLPIHESLDRVAQNNPVYLTRVDGHACWVNKRAMEIAGISKQMIDPPDGKIVRDVHGEPTGVFVDGAMELIHKFLPEPNNQEMHEAIRVAVKECASFGLTSVHEMGVDWQQIELYKKMIKEENFSLRIYAAVDGSGELWDRMKKEGKVVGYGKNKLTVRAMKLYLDGALGSHGAALIDPYSDDLSNRGLTVISEENLQKMVEESQENGFQVCTHAIGDRANHIVLNVYESVLKKSKLLDSRLRIEHAQVLAPEDIPRFKILGIIPSMQPVYCTSDMYWAEARLGSKRIRSAYVWRSLLNTGVFIPGGSDFPIESPNPFLGIYAACTRQDLNGRPRNSDDVRSFFQLSNDGLVDTTAFKDGWYFFERMTREEAIRSFTTWAAYAAFEEKLKGSLESGKLADFIIISNDIFTCPLNAIPAIQVESTILGGKIVFTH
jgi:predicted amidohydrolase YtcJ